jgi:muconolactone D-isomerase
MDKRPTRTPPATKRDETFQPTPTSSGARRWTVKPGSPEAQQSAAREPDIIPPVEFLVEIDIKLPHDLDDVRRSDLLRAESARGAALAESGIIRAIWRVPGRLANRGIWEAPDATSLHEALVSLPLWPFMAVSVVPLARHPLAEHCRGLPPGLVATVEESRPNTQ